MVGLAMFVGVLGWGWSNKAKYIGEDKVEGSIRGRSKFILFGFLTRSCAWAA
jgi:hypothetical protein